MKTISVPAAIENELDGKPVPFTFREFCTVAVEHYELFGKGYANIKKADAIMQKVADFTDLLVLEDDHFACLKDAVNAMRWNPKMSRKLIPFFEAFEAAAK